MPSLRQQARQRKCQIANQQKMTRFWRLLQYANNYKGLIAMSILCNVLTALFTVVSAPAIIPFLQILFGLETPLLEQPPVDWSFDGIKANANYYLSYLIQTQGKQGALVYVCVGIILIFFFKNLFRYLSMFFMAPVRNGMVRDIRQQLFDQVIRLDMAWMTEKRKGDLIARMATDVQEVEWSIFNVLVTIFREPLVIIGSLLFLLYVSPQLTLFVFVLMLFTGIIIGGIGKTLKQKSNKVQETLGNLIAKLEENLSGLRIIKSFGAEDFQSQQFRKENNRYQQLLTKLLWRRDLSSPLSEFLGITMVAILLWYGSGLVFSGELRAESFLAFLLAFFNVSQPTKAFSAAFYNIQKGMAAVERIDQILLAAQQIKDPIETKKLTHFDNAIAFKKVSFRYNKSERYVLKNINFSIPKGKVIAIVGASGSGKTTLVDILLRLYQLEEGEIEIDGIPIEQLTLQQLRQQFGVVSQDPVLFNDTIFNNIAFGLSNISREAVQKAAQIAHAEEFIQQLPQQYETVIGDGGNKLSGGQRQRLTIARAILRNPPILILDEATSALDAASERLVQSALKQIMRDRTTIIIAHRLSTIKFADEIIVLREGSIVERGTHQQLLNQQGVYEEFVQLQLRG